MISRVLTVLALAVALAAAPASAHKQKHDQHARPSNAATQPASGAAVSAPISQTPVFTHSSMGEAMGDMDADRTSLSTFERLLDWLGRLHPIVVHFPIAFFPAALFTAVVGRRRPAFGKPVQFLVVAGGVLAPVSAILGWLAAINADPDPLVTVHRWLGTAVGAGGLGLAIWAVRKPDQDRGAGMIIALAVITAAIIVQGWYGGALVHGIDHMNW